MTEATNRQVSPSGTATTHVRLVRANTIPPKRFIVFGERCSGTNHLRTMVRKNLHLQR